MLRAIHNCQTNITSPVEQTEDKVSWQESAVT
jgi:hypothetical protein